MRFNIINIWPYILSTPSSG